MTAPTKRVFLSSCGTSLLTNGVSEQVRLLLSKHANAQKAELPEDIRKILEARICEVEKALFKAEDPSSETKEVLSKGALQAAAKRSAELNGLLHFYSFELHDRREDIHILLHTDTYLGEECARLLQGWLQGRGFPYPQMYAPVGLKTSALEEFHAALVDLVGWCEATFPGYQESGYQVIFNLTGGFKSIQGVLQTLGMFYADEAVYLFESGKELLRVPKLPIVLDDRTSIKKNATLFRRLAWGEDLTQEETKAIPSIFLFLMEGKSSLSAWGRLVWERSKKEIYGPALLEPLEPLVRYSEGFRRDAKALNDERRVILNERLEQLLRHLKGGPNLRSLDFKRLEGDPVPPSTHECDAWSDRDARRVFGHFEEGVFVVDRLGKHL